MAYHRGGMHELLDSVSSRETGARSPKEFGTSVTVVRLKRPSGPNQPRAHASCNPLGVWWRPHHIVVTNEAPRTTIPAAAT